MERAAYEAMANIEGRHWWFVGRRAILTDVIANLTRGERLAILEVGCGTGGNLDMLSGFGDVTGVEPDAEARHFPLPDRLPGLSMAGCPAVWISIRKPSTCLPPLTCWNISTTIAAA